MRNIKRISVLFVVLFSCFRFSFDGLAFYDVVVQNRIIDSFNSFDDSDFIGYIEIPKFRVRRLVKSGTSSDVLDNLYVGLFELSNDINSSGLIVLAGHNVSNVFSCLHSISDGDFVYIGYRGGVRRFIVYDRKVVSEFDFSYFSNRENELLLITCDKKGYRLLVFLREDL